MPKRARSRYGTGAVDRPSRAQDIQSNGRLTLRHDLSQDDLEELKRLVKVQAQTISDLQKQLDNEKQCTQQYKTLCLQLRHRLRSLQDGDFVCVVTMCEKAFNRDDRVRKHIRSTEDEEHQRLAQYLKKRECPGCGQLTSLFFRHLFSCDREQYRLVLGEFYGVEISDNDPILPPAIFKVQSFERIERIRMLRNQSNVDISDEIIDFHSRKDSQLIFDTKFVFS